MDGEKVVPAPAIPLRVARPVGVALVLALATLLWPTLFNLRARQTFAHAADARVAGDEAAFVASAEKAAAIAPWESFYLTQLAAFFGDQYLQAPDATARTRALDRCRALLRQALAINPDQEYCHFNLGWLLLPEDPAAAEKHFRAAARFSPYRGGVYLGVGLSRLAQNERSAATDAFALEWLNDPQALASPRWHTPPLAALRSEVAAALHRLADRWRKESALSAPARRQVDYVVSLADWWSGAMVDTSLLIRLGSAEQQRFFRSLPAIEQRTYAPTDAGGRQPWEELYLAWRDKAAPSGLAAKEPSFAAALTRRITATPASFARVLAAPPDGDSSLIQYRRNKRPGYGVLERNQDGFLLRDLYIFPQNLLVEKYASFLFPPKGYLPTGLLLRSLDQVLAGPP